MPASKRSPECRSERAVRLGWRLAAQGVDEHVMLIPQAAAIEKNSGRIGCVFVAYELKSAINREMNREQGPSPADRRQRLARDFELPVTDDRLALRDVRIEYIDRD